MKPKKKIVWTGALILGTSFFLVSCGPIQFGPYYDIMALFEKLDPFEALLLGVLVVLTVVTVNFWGKNKKG